ncbi:hypothetical protein BH10BAC5_BH10BAC5_01760 [soil metagenome]
MKKLYSVVTVFALLFIFNSFTNAQTLSFCEDVNSKGNPVNYSTTFNIGSGGGYLYFLVNLPYNLNSRSVKYDIFRLDSYGSEVYDNTIYQDTELSWDYFYKQVTFYKSGTYNIYVYDSSDYMLASGSIKINMR